MRTGDIEKHYVDMNPQSSTYMQERVEIVHDDVCLNWQPEMVAVETREDEIVYKDMNPNSYTFGQKAIIPIGSEAPYYIEAYSMCEQILYNNTAIGNNGQKITYNVDVNPNSETYKDLSSFTETSEDCPLPDMSQKIETTESCKLKEYLPSGVLGTYGIATITGTDINPYSPTYNQIIYENDIESPTCFIPSTESVKIEVCSYCKTTESGIKVIILEDINSFSETFGTQEIIEKRENNCII